jgi:hypothetical protein
MTQAENPLDEGVLFGGLGFPSPNDLISKVEKGDGRHKTS